MRFYLASGLPNHRRAGEMAEYLISLGHTPTYNWTLYGDVREQGEERMRQTSSNEIAAVVNADLVLIMLPGGAGTHAELGAALATRENKRILIWSESGKEFGGGQDTCVFYHHPAINHISGSVDELKQTLKEIL